MRDMDLVAEGRPAGPVAQSPLIEEESRWGARLRFGAAVVLGLVILGARTAVTRPFATIVAIGFFAGALAVGGNLFAQRRPHPAPLFARAERVEPAPAAPRDPIAELASRPVEPAPAVAAAATSSEARDRTVLLRDLQGELTRLGHYQGTIDGRFGPRTDRAIRAAETATGLPVTGQPSERLLARLRQGPPETTATVPPQRRATPASAPAAPPAATPVEPAIVRAVQRRLADMGYSPGRLDGSMTPEFRRAVARFQQDNDLSPTGVVDRATVDRIAAIFGPIT